MFAISGRNLPSVSSYEDAVKVWNESYVHDRFDGWRGLANKRDTSKTVRMYENGRIAFRYHHTDLVTWVSPTRIETIAHDSQSSRIFADAFLPAGVHLISHRGRAYIQVGYECFEGSHSNLTLNLTNNEWVPENPVLHLCNYLNRQKAAEIRKGFKPWMEWRDSVRRLRGEPKGTNISHWQAKAAFQLIASGSDEAYTNEYYDIYAMHLSDLLPRAYALLGAVEKQSMPRGQLPRKTVYDSYI